MKKFIIPVAIFFLIGTSFLVFMLSSQYNRVQYDKDVSYHISQVYDNGYLYSEYNNVKTSVIGYNVSRIQSAISISERKRLYFEPDFNNNNPIILSFSSGAAYTIYENTEVDDQIYILYIYKNKKQWYSIQGYNSMKWITTAISPLGIKNENIIIEEDKE